MELRKYSTKEKKAMNAKSASDRAEKKAKTKAALIKRQKAVTARQKVCEQKRKERQERIDARNAKIADARKNRKKVGDKRRSTNKSMLDHLIKH